MSLDGFLEAWLAPLDVRAFRDDYFGRRPLFREARPGRLGALQGLRRWDALDLLAGRTRDVRAWFEATDGRHLTADVAPEVARKLYQAGTTFYVKDLAELAPVRDSIARLLRLPAGNLECGIFCNRPGAKTRLHFDPVNLFTVQITGRKRWRVAPNRHAPDPNVGWATLDDAMSAELRLSTRGPMPERMPPGAEEYVLEPGAMLYVPRGFWHETDSDEESISLHVYQIALPWADAVLSALRAKLVRDPAWRADASTLWDPTRRAADEATLAPLLRGLLEHAAGLAPDDVLPAPRPPASAPGPGERFARRATASFFVRSRPNAEGVSGVTFSAVEQGTERRTTVEMSEAYLRACDLFVGPAPPALSARDLAARVPDLEPDEALGLVNLLLDVGFLRPAA